MATRKPAWLRKFIEDDWTIDPETHRSNSSPEYLRLVEHVARLIRNSAHDLIGGRAESVARLIMAQLAHVHGLAPRAKAKRKAPRWTAEEIARAEVEAEKFKDIFGPDAHAATKEPR
jgi:dihydroneopterin aldolase